MRWTRLLSWMPHSHGFATSGLGSVHKIARRRVSPRLEMLEDRCLLTTVNTLQDGVTGSLRDAIASTAAGGTVDFLSTLNGTITLQGVLGVLAINKNLTIQGPGALTITVSGNSQSQVFTIAAGNTVTISGLTITAGQTTAAGAGGAINNAGTLVLSNDVISSSKAGTGGGGALFNSGTLTITNSTLNNNSSTGPGGAIINSSTLSLTNDTLTANSNSSGGGGAISTATGTVSLLNVTVASNTTTTTNNNGGGILIAGGTVNIQNSIVALNTAPGGNGPDVSGTVNMATALNNLIGDGTGSVGFSAANGNLVGTSGSPINPQLGSLKINGGTTPTLALQSTSPAIDKGTNTGAPATDQRGFKRTVNNTTDIGAYEFQPPATGTVLQLSTTTSNLGQSVTLTATVTGAAPGSNTVTGTVSFFDGATQIGTPVNLAGGMAAFSTAALAAGSHTLTATYNGIVIGDFTFTTSTSTAQTLTVTKATTTTTVQSSNTTTALGQAVTFTATVTPSTVGTFTAGGTVTFFDSGTQLGAPVNLAGGTAALNTAGLGAGTHVITATYNGDTNFATSTTTTPVTQTVTKATTTTTIQSSNTTSTFGQSVTFTATVTPSTVGTFTAGGTVTFLDNGTPLGSPVNLSNGSAALVTSTLSVGSHTITATYNGDANFATSTTTTPVHQTVNKATTTTTIQSSNTSSPFGQPVTFTATVTPSSVGTVAAGGTVAFFDGGTQLGTPVNLANGTATFTTSTLSIGAHVITATYSGDANFSGSTTTTPVNQMVTKATTTTTIQSSNTTINLGQSVTFTAMVTPTTVGSFTAGGTVTFFDGTTQLGTPVNLVGGTAALTTAALSGGANTITATYNGDTNFATSTSTTPVNEMVNKATTTTTLQTSSGTTNLGQSVTFTATVTPNTVATFTAGGTVTFFDGGVQLGTPVNLTAGGTAALTTAALTAGTHTITATYNGDTNFATSTSTAPVTQTVNKATTTTAVVSGLPTSVVTQPVTFTATVTPNSVASFTAGGTVSFFDGTTQLGTPVNLTAGGTATLTTSILTLGTHQISAVYNGDPNFAGSTSPAATQTVTLISTTSVLINTPSTSTVNQKVTYTVTVTPGFGTGTPTGSVTFLSDGTPFGTATLSGGIATLTTSLVSLGTHQITATYPGDTATYASSAAPAKTQTVTQASTTTVVTSSLMVAKAGQSVTFTATVTPSATGAIVPTGTVTFMDGATQLGTPVTLTSAGTAAFTSSTLTVGPHTITAKYNGDTNFTASTSSAFTELIRSGALFALGGSQGHVQVRKTSDGSLVVDFTPYGSSFSGAITVAMGDVNGDGFEDLIVGSAAGSAHVKVYDGKALNNGTFTAANAESNLIASFMAYDPKFSVGVNVAAAYVNGDTFADIITGASIGNPHVKVYNSAAIANGTFNTNPEANLLASFFAYTLNTDFGATVAGGDINGDGFADVVTGASSGNPHVKVYDGKAIHSGTLSSSNPDASLLTSFIPYGTTFRIGVNVAVGDVNGDGFADIITGPTVGSPDVRIFDGKAIANGTFNASNPDATRLDQFFAFDPKFGTGVNVAANDFDNDGKADILCGASSGSPHYRVVDGLKSTGTLPPALLGIDAILANFTGGVFVGV
jgi:hypothetical protein